MQRASQAELAGLAARIRPDRLNFPVSKYTADVPLLPKLAQANIADLEEHLAPHRLAQWERDSTGGSAAAAGDGQLVSAAARRRDNTSKFTGVSRNSGGSGFEAAITGWQ